MPDSFIPGKLERTKRVMSRHLLECGFHVRGAVPVQVSAPRNPTLHERAVRVQMLDNDTAYRHTGRNEFWA